MTTLSNIYNIVVDFSSKSASFLYQKATNLASFTVSLIRSGYEYLPSTQQVKDASATVFSQVQTQGSKLLNRELNVQKGVAVGVLALAVSVYAYKKMTKKNEQQPVQPNSVQQ